MTYPIESSFAEKLSLGDSKTRKKNRSKKPKSKLDKRSDLKRPGTPTKPNAMIHDDDDSDSGEEVLKSSLGGSKKKTMKKMKKNRYKEPKSKFVDDGSDSDEMKVLGTFTAHELDEALEMGVDPLEDLLYRSEKFRINGPKYADAALSYMRGNGHNLELVKPGAFESTYEEEVQMIHFNFKAKRADDPNAHVETYFSQLNDYWSGDLTVDCCVSVGKSAPPIHKRSERDMQGCEICCGKLVHHPVGGCEGIDWGHVTWVPWVYAK